MSTPHRPRLKSITHTPSNCHDAEPAAPQATLGDPKGVAEGVPTAVRPDPQRGDGRYAVAWLTIRTPYGATPTATSTCLCGWDRSATGHADVWALTAAHEAHRDTCPLRTPQEGRAAA
ncbi:hypothetical protein [Streptomyces sp. NPDC093544]|uniref:hypothetical protein n=1 Tax=Streptomyces sp. NPDC093544 TaxID=3155200 RepID=UPI0034272236